MKARADPQLPQPSALESAEERLRASEERYRQIIENLEDPYYEVDLKGQLILINPAFARLLGYPAEELRGTKYSRYQEPAAAEKVYGTFNQVYRTGVPAKGFDWEIICRDGSRKTIEGSVNLVRDPAGRPIGFRGIMRDVTARREVEFRLRESEARFRSLTELSSDWYWEVDEQYRLTHCAGRLVSKHRPAFERFLGKRLWEIGLQMEGNGLQELRAAHEARRPFEDVVLYREGRDGRRRYTSMSGEPAFDERQRFIGYRGVGRDITERRLAEERVRYLATHDGLTGLPNRGMFSQLLNHALGTARRHGHRCAVLFIDLDRFKLVNDTLGHEAGDRLLQEVARALKAAVRASDVIARLGGDEFVVLAQDLGHPGQAAAVARKLLNAARQPVMVCGQECRVTASIGISLFPADAEDEQALMRNADIAMYQAKAEGKNTYQFYSRDGQAQSMERLAVENRLRRALERGEFSLHYQPKLDLASFRLAGAEALLRWENPELGTVPPAEFIPLAEETGLIVPLGRWALRAACEQHMAWRRAGLHAGGLAVNLSPRQFADPELLSHIAAVLRDTGLAPDYLELEITESTVMHNADRAVRMMSAVKDLGVSLAIDDFGTGYSSLGLLKRFPIDTLKVDRSFIREIPQNAGDKAITQAIIAMGRALNLTVVAEGVETQAQQAFLREHGCDQMQGYYFSPPLAAPEFAAFLAHPDRRA